MPLAEHIQILLKHLAELRLGMWIDVERSRGLPVLHRWVEPPVIRRAFHCVQNSLAQCRHRPRILLRFAAGSEIAGAQLVAVLQSQQVEIDADVGETAQKCGVSGGSLLGLGHQRLRFLHEVERHRPVGIQRQLAFLEIQQRLHGGCGFSINILDILTNQCVGIHARITHELGREPGVQLVVVGNDWGGCSTLPR